MSITTTILRKDLRQFRILIGLLSGLLAVLVAVRLEWTGSVMPDPAAQLASSALGLEAMLVIVTVILAGKLVVQRGVRRLPGPAGALPRHPPGFRPARCCSRSSSSWPPLSPARSRWRRRSSRPQRDAGARRVPRHRPVAGPQRRADRPRRAVRAAVGNPPPVDRRTGRRGAGDRRLLIGDRLALHGGDSRSGRMSLPTRWSRSRRSRSRRLCWGSWRSSTSGGPSVWSRGSRCCCSPASSCRCWRASRRPGNPGRGRRNPALRNGPARIQCNLLRRQAGPRHQPHSIDPDAAGRGHRLELRRAAARGARAAAAAAPRPAPRPHRLPARAVQPRHRGGIAPPPRSGLGDRLRLRILARLGTHLRDAPSPGRPGFPTGRPRSRPCSTVIAFPGTASPNSRSPPAAASATATPPGPSAGSRETGRTGSRSPSDTSDRNSGSIRADAADPSRIAATCSPCSTPSGGCSPSSASAIPSRPCSARAPPARAGDCCCASTVAARSAISPPATPIPAAPAHPASAL